LVSLLRWSIARPQKRQQLVPPLTQLHLLLKQPILLIFQLLHFQYNSLDKVDRPGSLDRSGRPGSMDEIDR